MTAPTIFDHNKTVATGPIFEEGDAAVIIKRNGDIVPLTVGVNDDLIKEISEMPEEAWTEDHRNILAQGRMLYLLVTVASNAAILSEVIDRLNIDAEANSTGSDTVN